MLKERNATNIFICETCSNFFNGTSNVPGVLKCGHLICKSCYYKSHKKCPVCRHHSVEFIQVYQLMIPALGSLQFLADEIKSIEDEKNKCIMEHKSTKLKLELLKNDYDPELYQAKIDTMYQYYNNKEFIIRNDSNTLIKTSIREISDFCLQSKFSEVHFMFSTCRQESYTVKLKKNITQIPEIILLLFCDAELKNNFSRYDVAMRCKTKFGKSVTIPYIFDLSDGASDAHYESTDRSESSDEEIEYYYE